MSESPQECPREQMEWNNLRIELAALQSQGNNNDIEKKLDNLVRCGKLEEKEVLLRTTSVKPQRTYETYEFRTKEGELIARGTWHEETSPPLTYMIIMIDKDYFAQKTLKGNVETFSKQMDLYALYKRLQLEVNKAVDWKGPGPYYKVPFGMGNVSSDITYFQLGEDGEKIDLPVPDSTRGEYLQIGKEEVVFGLDLRTGRVTPYKHTSDSSINFDKNGFENEPNKIPLTPEELKQYCQCVYEKIKKLQRGQLCAKSWFSRKCIFGP